ncbi:MAG TPA: SRPBCC family protein [Reyranella sp.]|nr:SRPBCC family protein [Reyranella sp.]
MNDSDYGKLVSPTEVRFERLLPGPIETVWAFITDSEKRGEWFASGPMELRVGAKFTLRFKHSSLSPNKAPAPERFREMDKTGHEWTGEITEVDPPRRLAFFSNDSEVVFDLKPVKDAKGEDKVLLILTHRRLPNREMVVGVMGGWHSHLAVLVDKAHGRTPPAFWDIWRANDGVYDKRVPPDCCGLLLDEATGRGRGDIRAGLVIAQNQKLALGVDLATNAAPVGGTGGLQAAIEARFVGLPGRVRQLAR